MSQASECYEKLVESGLAYAKAKAEYEMLCEKKKTIVGALFRECRAANMTVADSEHGARAEGKYIKHCEEMHEAHLAFLEAEVDHFARRQYWEVWKTMKMVEMSEAKNTREQAT